MSYPSKVRHLRDELLSLRSNGLTLIEISRKYGVSESSIRKTIGTTGCVRDWKSLPISKRFWEKVSVKDTEKCWEWHGAFSTSGYGHIILNGKVVDAHRVSYILEHGEIPQNTMILHNCNNKKCVNPKHLRSGTQTDNMADLRKARKEGEPSITLRKV